MLDDIEPALKATSNRIRELREDQGLSIQAMAIKARVDPKQLKKIENGATITSALWLSRFIRNFEKDLCDFYDERFIELYVKYDEVE